MILRTRAESSEQNNGEVFVGGMYVLIDCISDSGCDSGLASGVGLERRAIHCARLDPHAKIQSHFRFPPCRCSPAPTFVSAHSYPIESNTHLASAFTR
eukprot:scaffold16716_cov146-Skeletonema_dohrnii-CCMP3373.AAC.1